MIDIKQEFLLPFHIRVLGFFLMFFGVLGIGVGLYLLFRFGQSDWLIWLSPIFAILGSYIFFSHYRLEIDPHRKTYTVVTKMPFLKSGKPEHFNYISRIYINPVKETTTFTSRAAMRYDSTKQLYKAFMKLDDGEKVHMDTDSDEKKIRQRVDGYIRELKAVYRPE
ncbi:MAG: hypothetical protein P8X57_03000 [Cyclobacteriaceae bacterium]